MDTKHINNWEDQTLPHSTFYTQSINHTRLVCNVHQSSWTTGNALAPVVSDNYEGLDLR